MKHRRFKRKVLDLLDLPADSDQCGMRVTMVGNTDLLIEGHAGVLQYSDKLVRFLTKESPLRVEGTALTMRQLSADRAYICGAVSGWRYEDGV